MSETIGCPGCGERPCECSVPADPTSRDGGGETPSVGQWLASGEEWLCACRNVNPVWEAQQTRCPVCTSVRPALASRQRPEGEADAMLDAAMFYIPQMGKYVECVTLAAARKAVAAARASSPVPAREPGRWLPAPNDYLWECTGCEGDAAAHVDTWAACPVCLCPRPPMPEAEPPRERENANRASHKAVTKVGDGELLWCEACKSGEGELWERPCVAASPTGEGAPSDCDACDGQGYGDDGHPENPRQRECVKCGSRPTGEGAAREDDVLRDEALTWLRNKRERTTGGERSKRILSYIIAALRPSRPAPRETPDWEGFVREMFDAPDRGDWDGGEIQEVAVKHGVLREVTVTEPCSPEGCVCAEVDAFPLTCYRLAPKSAAPRETEPSERTEGSVTVVRDAMHSYRDLDADDCCEKCMGWGKYAYGSTATWHGGIGGARMTTDVCDACWGSGSKSRPWPSHRAALRASNGGAET